jgi:hypothetical protein
MKKLLAPTLLAALLLGGCADLAKPTDQASPIVQVVDKALGIAKDAQGNVKATPPADPTGGTIPIVGTILSVASLAWYTIRKLSSSVPADTHDAAVKGLANSNPATVTTTVPSGPTT